MKVAEDPRLITVSQTNLAKALNLTVVRVQQLIQEGVVIRDDNDARGGVLLLQSVRNYDRMKNKGGPTADDEEVVDYKLEQAKHEKVKRELAEIKLAKAEARIYDARTVELVMTEMLSNLRTQLLGLPSKLAPILESKDRAAVYETMTKEIEEKLAELSEYSPDLFTHEEIGDSDEDGE